MEKVIERLEFELVRALDKNRKLEAENEEMKRKVIMYRSDKADMLIETIKKRENDTERLRDKVSDMLIETIKKREKDIEHLKDRVSDMLKYKKTFPSDTWYVAYLQGTVMKLERMCDDRQDIINQYQGHFAKYGKIYKDFDDRVV